MLSFKCTWVTFTLLLSESFLFLSGYVGVFFSCSFGYGVIHFFLPTQDCFLISSVLCYFSWFYCVLTFSFWYGVSFLFVLVIKYSFIFYWFECFIGFVCVGHYLASVFFCHGVCYFPLKVSYLVYWPLCWYLYFSLSRRHLNFVIKNGICFVFSPFVIVLFVTFPRKWFLYIFCL